MQTDINGYLGFKSEDLALYKYDLIINGLTAEQEILLNEIGEGERGKAKILHGMIMAELTQEASLQDPFTLLPPPDHRPRIDSSNIGDGELALEEVSSNIHLSLGCQSLGDSTSFGITLPAFRASAEKHI